jgi:ubiquinone/menaquinone biosynthesis C-methylase UbiE
MSPPPRHACDSSALPLVGRLSFLLGTRQLRKNFRAGRWLDLLCGYDALLLRQLEDDVRFTARCALDHQLDPTLDRLGIRSVERYLEGTLPFQDDEFENVTMVNGLEHLLEPQAILNECFRVLTPGGVLQIVVPTWFGKPLLEFLAFRLRNPQAYTEMNDHKLYYDERTLWPMLVRAGFKPALLRLRRIKAYCSLHARAVKA